ncbi:MAG: insulinase family protein [Burkholderiales bacterium]|nr:insulinase family protein [Burkholderiales bacterium]
MKLNPPYLCALAASLACSLALAQAPKPAATSRAVAPVTKITTVEGITEYRLANGLKVLLFPDPSKPTITVNVTYLVGSRMENYGETGMAHLLEHLMFKGTKKHPNIDLDFNKRGMQFNGTTWIDRTNYFEIFAANEDNLRWAIEMEADRMVNSFIAKKDLDSEMTVVRNEFEQGENSPFRVLLKRMLSVAYDWHSYGRDTIGNRSDIENVRIENLQAFYRMYYQPDNAVLLVAGKFDEAKTLSLIAKNFGAIPRPKRKPPPEWTVEPTQDGDRTFAVRRKGDVQIVAVAYHVPSGLHLDSDAVGFASFILGQVPTGRLHKAIVEKGMASQVFGYPMQGVAPGLQIFGAVVKPGDSIDRVRDELIKVVESFGDAPPNEDEIKRTRLSFANQAEKALANHEALGVQLSEYIALGDWRLFFLARDELEKIGAEQVMVASKKYFRRDNRTVGIFMPEDNPLRAEIPPAPTLAEVMKDFKPKQDTSVAESFDPSQANIEARTKRFEVDGIQVALLSKKNRGEIVNVSLAMRIGNEKALFGQATNASFAGRMLSRGTTKYTRAQLTDEFEALKVSGRVSGPGASIQTTRANLEGALRLVAHVLKEPSFPQSEFDQLVNQTVTSITASLSEPEARASDAIAKHFNSYPRGDWRYSPSLEESLQDVKAAKLEDVKRFHQQFYGAGPAQIAIVGDFDEVRAAALIKELFAGWKPAVPYQRVSVEFRDVPPTTATIRTPDKENAVLLARENVGLRDDDPDFPALFVADYIVGGGAGFDSRLMSRIRQKEGLSYGVGTELAVGSEDRAGSWVAYAIAAPQNMAKVEAAFREEVARALKDGLTESEVSNAKSGILQTRAQTRAQDGALASAWVGNLYLGRTFAWSKQFEERITALKAADVNAALRKYIDPAKLTVVKAGDFK